MSRAQAAEFNEYMEVGEYTVFFLQEDVGTLTTL